MRLSFVARSRHVDLAACREITGGLRDHPVLEFRLIEEGEVIYDNPSASSCKRIDPVNHIRAGDRPVEGERRPRREIVHDLEHRRSLVASCILQDLNASR